MKDPCQSQRFPVALAHSVQAFLCALALATGATGCRATPPLAQPQPPDAQTRPLTPQEWTQRNFPEGSPKASGQVPNLSPELARSPQTTSGPPAQAASSTPLLLAQASAPASLPAAPAPAPVQATNSPVSEPASAGANTNQPAELRFREGDAVRITFPGAHGMDTVQQIRRDGKITLQMIGDVKAAGLTRTELEQELINLYGPQLLDKEVQVTPESAAFAVYVTGAVMRPGKIMSDRPISAMEAIVEAGIDLAKSNLKKVRIMRQKNGRTEFYILDLKKPFHGKQIDAFDMMPGDIIYVPERFSWFSAGGYEAMRAPGSGGFRNWPR